MPFPLNPARQGLLYVATGAAYLEEAAASARASRPFAGGRPLAVVCDCPEQARQLGVFDQVLRHPDPRCSYRDKIPPLLRLPFARTLFLDSDARLTAPADALFAALGNAHLAAAQAPVRRPAGWWDASVPALFPELNSGVLLLRRCWRQRLLVRRWLRRYDQLAASCGQSWDQASLRSVVWRLQQCWGLRLALLPPEANLRTSKPWLAGEGLAVHVVHGRVPEPEWPPLLRYLNGNTACFRTWQEWQALHPQSAVRLKGVHFRAGPAEPPPDPARP
ncbi:hypothetical protein KBY57_13050 [Cyanobium sp. Aljojuca 7D2]|uniref:hypothetical protein n=1 Tax=Cyanobium sp. Aljojuca 7D2 TaxID=2823698 RepID=UPI0020CC78B1|nr:hypothetical protein [Cyanobium sp. Aljojuca 7D2]MCP9891972.1 hypothetical protein [Cyanobium sp. Aljojuca 7D2]